MPSRKSYVSECHNVLTADMYTPSGYAHEGKPGRKSIRNPDSQEDIDVCLTCTKDPDKCRGSKVCQRNRKKEASHEIPR